MRVKAGPIILVGLLTLTMSACTLLQTTGRATRPVHVTVETVVVTVVETVVATPGIQQELKVCTHLGCSGAAALNLYGDVPSSFIVQADGSDGNRVVVHCFEPDDKRRPAFTHDQYQLDDPVLEGANIGSEAPRMCRPEDSGSTMDVKRRNGALEQIIVYCNRASETSDGEPAPNLFFRPRCDGNGVDFWGWTPDYFAFNVYWDGRHKMMTVKPTYEYWYPNGPDCDEGCRSSSVWLKLP